jgi:hypothetical protein
MFKHVAFYLITWFFIKEERFAYRQTISLNRNLELKKFYNFGYRSKAEGDFNSFYFSKLVQLFNLQPIRNRMAGAAVEEIQVMVLF